MVANGGGETRLPPFPEPVEGLHFVADVDEKTGLPFDKLREREFVQLPHVLSSSKNWRVVFPLLQSKEKDSRSTGSG